MKPIRWRLIFVTALTLLAIYGISPTLIYFSQPAEIRNDSEEFLKKVPSWLPQSHANWVSTSRVVSSWFLEFRQMVRLKTA